ncbi:MAG: PAS domain S-box protein [Anaerolineales bacterium]|nr:PAS domain S-box protein [Anaerolineales bacterium]
MNFEIRTAMLGLAAGNLVFGLMLLLFQLGEPHAERIPYLATGKVLQGIGWLLLYGRGVLPDLLSFTVGNSCLIVGTAYDTWAMYRLSGKPVSRTLEFSSIAGVVFACILYTPLPAAARIATTSVTVMIFFALGGRIMLSKAAGNLALRRYIGWSMWLMVAVSGVRGIWATLVPEQFSLFAAHPIQLIMFGALYCVMLTNGFGMLLLAKEIADNELRESEARLRTIFSSAAIGMALLDLDRQPLLINPALARFMGRPAEQLLETSVQSVTHPDDWDEDLLLFGELSAGQRESYTIEKRYVRANGQVVWGRLTVSAIRDAMGAVTGAISMVQDITERKQIAEALQESEARYRLLAENMVDVIWVLNAAGQFTYISPSVTTLRGYTPEEVLAQPAAAALTPASQQVMMAALAQYMPRILQGAATFDAPPLVFELEQPCKDGSTVWTEAMVRTLFDDTGAFTGFLGLSRDITERKKTEGTLRESEEKFRLAFSNANTAMCLVDLQGNFLQVNDKMCAVFGYSKQELESKTVNDMSLPDDRALSPEFISHAIEGNQESDLCQTLLPSAGSCCLRRGLIFARAQ